MVHGFYIVITLNPIKVNFNYIDSKLFPSFSELCFLCGVVVLRLNEMKAIEECGDITNVCMSVFEGKNSRHDGFQTANNGFEG